MTVPAGSIKHVYNGNGIRNWDFTFPIYTDDGSDIKLYKTAIDGTVTEITANYSVDVVASHVVYPTVVSGLPLLATGEKITLRRVELLSQDIDWQNKGPFNAETVESAADKIMMIVQQQQEELSRAIKYPVDQIPASEDIYTYIAILEELVAVAEAAVAAAQVAQAAAETAETNAETAETNAEAAQGAAETAETNAETAETNAEAAQAAAEAARDLAQTYAAALKATSTSSVAIGIGEKTFTIQSGKQFAAGQFILIVDSADSDNYMHGQVTSYTGTTLVVDVQDIGGSGTKTSWNVYVSGSRGAQGEGGSPGTSGTFINGDLSSGKLTVTHSLGLSAPYTRIVVVVDNNGKEVDCPITFATNSFEIDLSLAGTISGTWGYRYI
jgi:hypothetical protein